MARAFDGVTAYLQAPAEGVWRRGERSTDDDIVVFEVMSEKVCYCFEDDDISEAARIMADRQVKRLPVLNREKRLVGIVALSDLGRADGDCAQTAVEGISEETGQNRRM